MTKDILTDEEWEDAENLTVRQKKHPQPANGGGAKQYIPLFLIAIVAIVLINRFMITRSMPNFARFSR
ncbi:hypothetical protein [Dethiobacter alkaliphilus]|uniref:Uncharacterized protein n=1 Tax=Dethiobacter alkaliphilus AHT 1 TaxID=555088 RepID=C0GDB4_DETAL|nr:hypothetical protein [Dethiobacter alkaliphilus]EEG78635.1 hypothetical protein DealDRAFT_0565 [Dethiobacter alkaliphilus AHT 1]